jgi:hypothetical protein
VTRKISLLFALALLSFSSYGQNWSGIISSSRAVDWSSAGVSGGIPTNRTQYGSTIAACSDVSTSTHACTDSINTAIAAASKAGGNYYVLLGAGTFNLQHFITFLGANNVTLRGMGADQTFLIFSGAVGNCNSGLPGSICIESATNTGGPPSHISPWTAGYSAATTTLTLTSVTGLVANQTPIFLDQCDTGLSGATNDGTDCSVGSVADGGAVFNCYVAGTCAPPPTPAGGSTRISRNQSQTVMPTAISGTGPYTVTISPGIYMANWAAGNNPGAWWYATYAIGDGVENLSIDNTAVTQHQTAVEFFYCYNCWESGVRSIFTGRNHTWIIASAHVMVQNNYYYGTLGATEESYGTEVWNASDNLVVNNIAQHVVTPVIAGGPDEGTVYAYNFSIDDYYGVTAGWFMPSDWLHAAGTAMDLFEGEQGVAFTTDNLHGTHNLTTLFRDYYVGDQPSCFGIACASDLLPFSVTQYSRYFNVIGSVLGQSGLPTAYQSTPTTGTTAGGTPSECTLIYAFGWSGDGSGQNACTYSSARAGLNDPYAGTSSMRWGNYDLKTAAVQWNSVEVPTALSDGYSNSVPASHTLPASFYYSSQPAFWNDGIGHSSIPWPATGPDVSGGNISNVGGYANNIPAELCYANSPVDTSYQTSYTVSSASWSSGMETLTFPSSTFSSSLLPQGEIRISGVNPPGLDGTFQITASTTNSVSFALASNPGSFVSGAMLYPNVRLFNANNCYPASGKPAPPTGLTAVVH